MGCGKHSPVAAAVPWFDFLVVCRLLVEDVQNESELSLRTMVRKESSPSTFTANTRHSPVLDD